MNPWAFIVILLLLPTVSCNHNSKQISNPTPQHEFYYFPKANTYYDVQAKKYIYSLDSAKTWNLINNEFDQIPSTLGDKQVIMSTTDSIWKYNAAHRNTYHGRIYSIIKANNGMPSSASPDARDKPKHAIITKKTEIADTIPDSTDRSKKGIRGFFKRLFGKHKKK